MKTLKTAAVLALLMAFAAEPAAAQRRPADAKGTTYRDITSPGGVRGIGTEANDIVSMTDQMTRDLLTVPALMNATTPPRVQFDASAFRNESAEIIDKAIITDRIRVALMRAAAGRISFLGRQNVDLVAQERELKDQGMVDVGTKGRTRLMKGLDYRLVGSIRTRDAVDAATGLKARFSTYTFELLDAETDELVWGNQYEFAKENRDHIVYR